MPTANPTYDQPEVPNERTLEPVSWHQMGNATVDEGGDFRIQAEAVDPQPMSDDMAGPAGQAWSPPSQGTAEPVAVVETPEPEAQATGTPAPD